MKFVIQRVNQASVSIDEKTVSSIDKGILILIGIGNTDDELVAEKMVEKTLKLRLFEDDQHKTNLSINDIDGEILLVSQFTLYADMKKGNRPSFKNAAGGDEAKRIYDVIVKLFEDRFGTVGCGIFGADMKINLVNDGPFTLILDSEKIL